MYSRCQDLPKQREEEGAVEPLLFFTQTMLAVSSYLPYLQEGAHKEELYSMNKGELN